MLNCINIIGVAFNKNCYGGIEVVEYTTGINLSYVVQYTSCEEYTFKNPKITRRHVYRLEMSTGNIIFAKIIDDTKPFPYCIQEINS